jgi:hypothetical protein
MFSAGSAFPSGALFRLNFVFVAAALLLLQIAMRRDALRISCRSAEIRPATAAFVPENEGGLSCAASARSSGSDIFPARDCSFAGWSDSAGVWSSTRLELSAEMAGHPIEISLIKIAQDGRWGRRRCAYLQKIPIPAEIALGLPHRAPVSARLDT